MFTISNLRELILIYRFTDRLRQSAGSNCRRKQDEYYLDVQIELTKCTAYFDLCHWGEIS